MKPLKRVAFLFLLFTNNTISFNVLIDNFYLYALNSKYMNVNQEIIESVIQLLVQLIKTPSLSREEDDAAKVVRNFLDSKNIPYETLINNTWCKNKYWSEEKPTILFDSHIDTVKPSSNYTYDPFGACIENDKLIGLGSNDAGGPLVSLLGTFLHFYDQKELPFNLIFAATAEEESSGKNGMAIAKNKFGKVDLAIIGEPTKMELAIAEKGLVVIDCFAKGKAGHAARNEGINSIYLALKDIEKIKNYKFEKVSNLLGEVKMTVTIIESGSQHNVVPDECKFTIDVRTNECYTNAEIASIIDDLIDAEVKPRSLRLNSSGIPENHPLVQRAKSLAINCYGSPTLSDQSLIDFTSVKIGPGDSARSHTADEYIYLSEIRNGVATYLTLLENLKI